MYTELKPNVSAAGLRVGLAVSRYHAEITAALRDAAIKQFTEAGGAADDLRIVSAPGAFELIAVCRALAMVADTDAIVAIGCVISGETMHDRYIAAAVAHGLSMITVQRGVPVTFGVLTCQNVDQAKARAGGDKGNKGAQAMAAAIETAHTVKILHEMEARC
ncbi:MAG: 6,7-dimethyl-8-ribityllumazine synthase [Planctomycetes bacterium]|nr:6,7-dimethyl-8-ribityllumazine synthase [Planctomycetota bacterium]